MSARWPRELVNVLMHDPAKHDLTTADVATCGTCDRSWCDTCHPTPSARCPFEYEHEPEKPTAQGHVEALAKVLTAEADKQHATGGEDSDESAFENYDVAYGLTAVQYLLEGGGPTTWATVVRNEDDDVVFVVLETHGFGDHGSTTLWGIAAERVGLALNDRDRD